MASALPPLAPPGALPLLANRGSTMTGENTDALPRPTGEGRPERKARHIRVSSLIAAPEQINFHHPQAHTGTHALCLCEALRVKGVIFYPSCSVNDPPGGAKPTTVSETRVCDENSPCSRMVPASVRVTLTPVLQRK